MDSLTSKFGILIFGIFLAKFIPSGLLSFLIFLFGIVLTLLVEIVVFLYYIAIKSEEYSPNSSPQRKQSYEKFDNFSTNYIRSPKKIQMTKYPLERRFTLMQCLCNGGKFALLITANDPTFSDLVGVFKEFLLADKKYANGLVKLGEVSVFEKIKSKKSLAQFKFFRDFCFETGKKYLKDNELMINGLVQDAAQAHKDIIKKYKDFGLRFRNAGEKFYGYSTEIVKLAGKLSELKEQFKEANMEFSDARKDLAQFETLVKKEMKLKKINNEVNSVKGQISKLMEAMHEESLVFAPKANEVMKDVSMIEKIISQKYKLFIEKWINYTLELITFSLHKLDNFTEPVEEEKSEGIRTLKRTMTFIKSALNKTEKATETHRIRRLLTNLSSSENSNPTLKHIEKKSSKLNEYISDVIKFLTYLNNLEEENYKDNLRILNSWGIIDNICIEDPLTELKNRLIDMQSYSKELRVEIFNCITKCKDFLEMVSNMSREALQYDSSVIDSQIAENRIIELRNEYNKVIDYVKEKVPLAYKLLYQKYQKELHEALEDFELMEDINENLSFNHIAKLHRQQCPYFIINIDDNENESSFVKEPEKVGEPESAIWLNDLLDTFISEWRHSPKFIAYICRRLKKIYNKDNPEYVGEIEVKDVEIGQEPPEIRDFTPLETENDYEFLYDFELWFRGDVKIHLEFDLKWSVAAVPVSVKVVLRSFYSKMRFFYAPSKNKCSWYSFISEPVNQISIEPVIGKMSKIALSKIPQINTLLVSALSRKIRKYSWPNKRSIKIFKGNRSEVPLE